MSTLYLVEQGAVAHRVGERVVVTLEDRVIADVPLVKITAVRVVGRGIALTTALMTYLMEHDIDTIFLSQYQCYRGRLQGRLSNHGMLRRAQLRTLDDPTVALALARATLRGKLVNQRFVLRRRAAQDAVVRQSMDGLAIMIARVEGAPSLEVLRGLEGQGAALYFTGFRRLLRHDLGFERRVAHPPTDPVNALLSFGYTLLLNDLISAIHLVGLDPYVGFLHVPGPDRPALALDLQEEFRPALVDRLVLELVNDGTAGVDAFTGGADGAPVLLGERLRAHVLRRYSERLATSTRYAQTGERTSYGRIVELQVRALARAVADGLAYRAFALQ